MKKVKFLFTILAISLAFGMATASPDNNQNPGQSGTHKNVHDAILRHNKEKSGRPNAPSRLYIECFYGDGFIRFVFPDGTQTLSVRVYNDSEEWDGVVSVTNPTLELPPLSGEYTVECSDDANRSFRGIIEY